MSFYSFILILVLPDIHFFLQFGRASAGSNILLCSPLQRKEPWWRFIKNPPCDRACWILSGNNHWIRDLEGCRHNSIWFLPPIRITDRREELSWAVFSGQFWVYRTATTELNKKASHELQSSGAKWSVSRDFMEHSSRLAVWSLLKSPKSN